MNRYTVNDGVRLLHDGNPLVAGDSVEMDDATAAQLIESGHLCQPKKAAQKKPTKDTEQK